MMIAIVIGGAILTGLLATLHPLLAIGFALAALVALVVIIWPDAPTLAVLFLIYTNAAVVAVQIHGVPIIIGAAVPLLLVIPLAYYMILRRQKLIINHVVLLMILFLAIQLFGAIFARRIDVALDKSITYVVEGLALYLLILNTVRTRRTLRLATWVLVIAGLLLGTLSVFQQATETYDNNYGGFAQVSEAAFRTGEVVLQGAIVQPRLAGPIGEQNRYAQSMLMLVPLALFLFMGERSKWLRVLAALSTVFIALGAVLTFSRGAAIGFVLLLIIIAFMRYIKIYQIVLVLLVLITVMLTVPQYRARLDSLQPLADLATGESGSGIAAADGSTKSRLTEMMAAGLVFIDYPVIGVGPGMYRYYYQEYAEEVGLRVFAGTRESHNLFLGIAAEHGALGLICFLLILYVTLRELSHARRHWLTTRPAFAFLATGFMLAVVSYMLTGIFIHFAYIRYFWLVMAMAGAVAYIARHEDEPMAGEGAHL
jgi:O-antigen ligase